MASITYTKSSNTGCGHFTLERSGAFSGELHGHTSEFLNNPPSMDELRAAERVILRALCNGKTLAQLNTAFTNGVTISA